MAELRRGGRTRQHNGVHDTAQGLRGFHVRVADQRSRGGPTSRQYAAVLGRVQVLRCRFAPAGAFGNLDPPSARRR